MDTIYYVTIGSREEEIKYDNLDEAIHRAEYIREMGGYADISDSNGEWYD